MPADRSEEETPGPSIHAGLITLGSTYFVLPVAIGLGATIHPAIATFGGVFGLPVAVGAGHIYAGDPVRGIGLGLLTYPVTFGSAFASWFFLPRPKTPSGWDGLQWVLEAAFFGVISGAVYSLFVAGDAENTRLRDQPGQTKNHNGSNQRNGYPWNGDDPSDLKLDPSGIGAP
ncbi:MAG: hypothetical protein VKN33_05875 [Candidatus Sericytochromatia bacterium]|nr:hypothetical protein [Candidatus Sericytochromatia bacterium]